MCSVALVLCVTVLVSEVVQWKSVHIKESTQSNTLKGFVFISVMASKHYIRQWSICNFNLEKKEKCTDNVAVLQILKKS